MAAALVDFGVVAEPQLDRIDSRRDRQLVHRGFQPERPARLAGRPHIGR